MERQISRRTMLRRTATLTTGVVAASRATFTPTNPAPPDPPPVDLDHDAATAESEHRDRHHRWETV